MPFYTFRNRHPQMGAENRLWGLDRDGKPREFANIFAALDAASRHSNDGGFFPAISNIEFAGDFDLTGVPTVDNPDERILQCATHGKLISDQWHSIDDGFHSRGGWLVHLAGGGLGDGYELEDKYGSKVAASLIYAASCPRLTVPNWKVYGDQAIEDMRVRAAAWAAGPPFPDIPWRPMECERWSHEKWKTIHSRAVVAKPAKTRRQKAVPA